MKTLLKIYQSQNLWKLFITGLPNLSENGILSLFKEIRGTLKRSTNS